MGCAHVDRAAHHRPHAIIPAVFNHGGSQPLGELFLDPSPPHGIVGILFRYGPDAMKVIGQEHPGVDGKGTGLTELLQYLPQQRP